MCGRYVVTNPVSKTNRIVKSAIQIEDTENYKVETVNKSISQEIVKARSVLKMKQKV